MFSCFVAWKLFPSFAAPVKVIDQNVELIREDEGLFSLITPAGCGENLIAYFLGFLLVLINYFTQSSFILVV